MTDALVTPCRGVCEMDTETEWCRGCGRTAEEISDWHTYDPATRKNKMRTELRERLRKMGLWPMKQGKDGTP